MKKLAKLQQYGWKGKVHLVIYEERCELPYDRIVDEEPVIENAVCIQMLVWEYLNVTKV